MLPIIPVRSGVEITLKIYMKPFLSIKFVCAVRQPSPYVCIFYESNVLFHMLHLELHFAFHIPPFILLTALFPLHIPYFTLTIHTSHLKLHSPHFSLFFSHSTFHTSHYTLHTPHCISSKLFSPYPSSFLLISSSLRICHASFHESLPSTLLRNLHAPCASQARVCVLCARLLQCCCPRI